jgi:phosphate:Na+ symporter
MIRTVIIILVCFFIGNGLFAGEYQLVKPQSPDILNYSVDEQYEKVRTDVRKPLRVKVIDDKGVGVADVPVRFRIMTIPPKSEGAVLQHESVTTDSAGYAVNLFTLGDKPGDYIVTANISGNNTKNCLVVFREHARKQNWMFFLIIGLFGGLSLFLFGMHMMSEGMQKSAGDRMRSILSTLTHNRFIATGVGAFVTMIIQSSSATVVMLVSFVNSRLMRFEQTIGIMLGAAIGTTVTAQIIAFKLTDYSLLLIAIGFSLHFFSKKNNYRYIGQGILGFGVLFFGMDIMSGAMYPLRTHTPFLDMLVTFENPLIGIATGMLLTALIQSSSAFIGIMIIVASQGLLTLEASIPLIIGANVGTVITAVLASLNGSRAAKRVAIGEGVLKIIGALLIVGWIPAYTRLSVMISPPGTEGAEGLELAAEVLPRQIANAHTIFNVLLTIAVLPFTRTVARFINKLLPDKEVVDDQTPFTIIFLDDKVVRTPSLALNLAKQETLRLGGAVLQMYDDCWKLFDEKDKSLIDRIIQTESKADYLSEQINVYVSKITRGTIADERIPEAFQIMYVNNELEQIGDIISTNILHQAEKWASGDQQFSLQGKAELKALHARIRDQIENILDIFSELNLQKAERLKSRGKQYQREALESTKNHFNRLQDEITESIKSSKIHIELTGLLDAVNKRCINVAKFMIKEAGDN